MTDRLSLAREITDDEWDAIQGLAQLSTAPVIAALEGRPSGDDAAHGRFVQSLLRAADDEAARGLGGSLTAEDVEAARILVGLSRAAFEEVRSPASNGTVQSRASNEGVESPASNKEVQSPASTGSELSELGTTPSPNDPKGYDRVEDDSEGGNNDGGGDGDYDNGYGNDRNDGEGDDGGDGDGDGEGDGQEDGDAYEEEDGDSGKQDEDDKPYESSPPSRRRKRDSAPPTPPSSRKRTKLHQNATDPSRQYRCTQCSASYTSPTGLKKHMNSAHSQKDKFHCPFPGCRYEPPARETIMRHLKTIHKIPLPNTRRGMGKTQRDEVRREQARVFRAQVGEDADVGFFLDGVVEGGNDDQDGGEADDGDGMGEDG